MTEKIVRLTKNFQMMAHLVLYGGLVLGVVAVYLYQFDAMRQFLIVLLLILFYLIWGFAYHLVNGDIKRRLIVEYLAISLIALLVAFIVFMS